MIRCTSLIVRISQRECRKENILLMTVVFRTVSKQAFVGVVFQKLIERIELIPVYGYNFNEIVTSIFKGNHFELFVAIERFSICTWYLYTFKTHEKRQTCIISAIEGNGFGSSVCLSPSMGIQWD